jgi:hypothetical protein
MGYCDLFTMASKGDLPAPARFLFTAEVQAISDHLLGSPKPRWLASIALGPALPPLQGKRRNPEQEKLIQNLG